MEKEMEATIRFWVFWSRVVRWNNETEANMEAVILFGVRASGLRLGF